MMDLGRPPQRQAEDFEEKPFKFSGGQLRMSPHFTQTKVLFLVLASAGALVMTGCAGVPYEPGTAVPVDQSASSAQKKKKEEPKPIPIVRPSRDALQGDGIYYFNDNVVSQFRITDAIAQNGLYPVKESYSRGAAHGFTWGAGAAALLRGGKALDASNIIGVELAQDGHLIVHYRGEKPRSNLKLNIKLETFDMSGLPIGPYLKTRMNRPTPAGYLIGSKFAFPKGSLGYRARMWTENDEVLVPTKTAFTGSKSIEDFSKRFAKDIPYCLRYIPNRRAVPLGFTFEEPIVKKTARSKGRTVEKAQTGEAEIYRVKPGTIFCSKAPDSPRAVGTAKWSLRYVQGTRVLAFSFPEAFAAENFGVASAHRDALQVAFAEERINGGKRRLVPARIWLADHPMLDMQWRFNKTAADAVQDAIAQTADARRDWESRHQAQTKAKKSVK